jgi:hypothetical protein
MRTALLACAVAAALAAVAAAPAGATTVATRPGRATCQRARSHTLVSSPTARVYTVTGADDGEYGAPVTLYGCRRFHDRRRVMLRRFSSTEAVTFSNRRLAGRYVALTESVVDVACSKYMGAAPECAFSRLVSYDLRTGRVRARADSPAADALALSARGWLAWVGPADAAGQRTVRVRDSAGERVADSGAIDPRSLSVTGDLASWVRDGAERTATLR